MIPVEFYPPLKLFHVSCVTASGTLFAARAAGVLAGAPWPLQRPWRVLSMVIDTLLLAAGASLWAMLALNPVRDAWLGTKLALLVAYILLGTFALRRGRTPAIRAACAAGALAVLLLMVSIALRHDPAGIFGRSTQQPRTARAAGLAAPGGARATSSAAASGACFRSSVLRQRSCRSGGCSP